MFFFCFCCYYICILTNRSKIIKNKWQKNEFLFENEDNITFQIVKKNKKFMFSKYGRPIKRLKHQQKNVLLYKFDILPKTTVQTKNCVFKHFQLDNNQSDFCLCHEESYKADIMTYKLEKKYKLF